MASCIWKTCYSFGQRLRSGDRRGLHHVRALGGGCAVGIAGDLHHVRALGGYAVEIAGDLHHITALGGYTVGITGVLHHGILNWNMWEYGNSLGNNSSVLNDIIFPTALNCPEL